MTADINLPVILPAAFLASGSPGPTTLAIAGTSMASGRRAGLAMHLTNPKTVLFFGALCHWFTTRN